MSIPEETASVMAEARRGLIVRFIAQTEGFGLSHSSLQEAFDRMGRRVGIDFIKRDLAWLEGAELVKLAIDGTLTIATLTPTGEDVAHRRIKVPGVLIERS